MRVINRSGFRGVISCDSAADKEIGPLLESWIEASHRYMHKFRETPDNPWWYNERANVSILAGAAWLLGWAALEEYPCRKDLEKAKKAEGIEEPDIYSGRNDLYIGTPDLHLIFEAKHVWKAIPFKSSKTDIIDTGRQAALSDIRKVRYEQADRRFAATFIIPFIQKESAPGNGTVTEQIDKYLESIREKKKEGNLFYASQLEVESGTTQCFRYRIGDYYYPGVILILDEIDRPVVESR